MSRARREPTWVYIDEDIGHLPATRMAPPRDRRRHSRAKVREARRRMIARATRHIARWHGAAEAVRHRAARTFATTRTPRGWGNAYQRGWTKGISYKDRRLRDADECEAAE